MRLRQRRGTGINRKAIGAAVFAGVLVVGGVTGLQFASAGEAQRNNAAEIVVVDGQNFDIAGCEQLEINVGAVICDGQELEPEQDLGAAEEAGVAAQALEDSCDQFALDQQAAQDEAAGNDDQNAEEEADRKSKKVKRAIADKYLNGMEKAEKAEQEKAEKEAAEKEKAEQEQDAAVDDARTALLVACLDLAEAKEAAGEAVDEQDQNAEDQQNAEDKQNGKDQNAEDKQNADDKQNAEDEQNAEEAEANSHN
jgi:hypothetical protein